MWKPTCTSAPFILGSVSAPARAAFTMSFVSLANFFLNGRHCRKSTQGFRLVKESASKICDPDTYADRFPKTKPASKLEESGPVDWNRTRPHSVPFNQEGKRWVSNLIPVFLSNSLFLIPSVHPSPESKGCITPSPSVCLPAGPVRCSGRGSISSGAAGRARCTRRKTFCVSHPLRPLDK